MLICGKRMTCLYLLWGSLFGLHMNFIEFYRDVMFIYVACISPVLDIASGQSWSLLGNSGFGDLKISTESLKSHRKIREI